MPVERLSLRRQADPLAAAGEKLTAQGGFQELHGAGNVGLTAAKEFRRLCEASVFGGIVKNAVAVVADIHRILHIILIYLREEIDILHMALRRL